MTDLARRSTFRHKVRIAAVAALASAGALGACGDDTTGPDDTARVQVLLTDAPSDMLDSAWVWISHIYLVGGGSGDAEPDTVESDDPDVPAGRVDLYNDPADPLLFDLLTLRDGVTADLTGEVPVEVANYRGLRFVVDSTRVVLAAGYTFEDGSTVAGMKVPSGQRSGIKVKLRDILSLDENDLVTVTVDFDVDENFNIQTNNQTGQIRRILFRPVLREKGRSEG